MVAPRAAGVQADDDDEARTPDCRLAANYRTEVERALSDAADAYRREGRALPFTRFTFGGAATVAPATLRVEIVTDAAAGEVNAQGCPGARRGGRGAREPDDYTVRGVCEVEPESNLLRCSRGALAAVLGSEQPDAPASAALLYVIAHELGHILQQKSGHFSGRVQTIDLASTAERKLTQLRRGCERALEAREEQEADEMALRVLAAKLDGPPYREPALNPRGSLLWQIDRIRLAAARVQQWRGRIGGEAPAGPHELFDPDAPRSLPASDAYVAWAAARFLCDVFGRTRGTIRYPLRETTHPSAEKRMGRVAEALVARATRASDEGGTRRYQPPPGSAPLAQLQEDTSGIFAFMDRAHASYVERLHTALCRTVNAGAQNLNCRAVSPKPPPDTP